MDSIAKRYEERNTVSMELTRRAFEFVDTKDVPFIFNTANYFSFGYSPDELPDNYYTSIQGMYDRQVGQFAIVGLGERHELADDLMGLAEGDAPADEVLGQDRRVEITPFGGFDQAIAVERRVSDDGGGDLERGLERVVRAEQVDLVLLQIAVVGLGQSLGQGEHPGQGGMDSAHLTPDELADVGVLLLRHHGGAGAKGVGDGDEAELLDVGGRTRDRHRTRSTARRPKLHGYVADGPSEADHG